MARTKPHPRPLLPPQHQPKPGVESKIRLRPKYEAPEYRGADNLKDCAALILEAIPASDARSPFCLPARAPTSLSCTCHSKRQTHRPEGKWWRARDAARYCFPATCNSQSSVRKRSSAQSRSLAGLISSSTMPPISNTRINRTKSQSGDSALIHR